MIVTKQVRVGSFADVIGYSCQTMKQNFETSINEIFRIIVHASMNFLKY